MIPAGKTPEDQVAIFRDFQYQFFYHVFHNKARQYGGVDIYYMGSACMTRAIHGRSTVLAKLTNIFHNKPRNAMVGMMVMCYAG